VPLLLQLVVLVMQELIPSLLLHLHLLNANRVMPVPTLLSLPQHHASIVSLEHGLPSLVRPQVLIVILVMLGYGRPLLVLLLSNFVFLLVVLPLTSARIILRLGALTAFPALIVVGVRVSATEETASERPP
jgi:hypothetical protein